MKSLTVKPLMELLAAFFFDAAPPLLAIHTTQTGNIELKVHRVHWQPPGFNMVSKVNLLF